MENYGHGGVPSPDGLGIGWIIMGKALQKSVKKKDIVPKTDTFSNKGNQAVEDIN